MQKALLGLAAAQLCALVAIAAILATGVTVANPVDAVTVTGFVHVTNPVETVTVANPVETVTVANPVETVRVSEIGAVVQVAVPNEAELYGECREQGRGYRVRITAVTGGISQTVADGVFTEGAAGSIGRYTADYYGTGSALSFGASSEECADIDGWE